MTIEGSYDISHVAIDIDREIKRLNSQVDLFWDKELALYRQLGLRDDMAVLDCGCGPAYLLEKLHNAYPAMSLTGIEIAEPLLLEAQKTIKNQNLQRCKVYKQSITALELPENSFDFVITRLLLEHLPQPLVALKQVLRVLKAGGRAVFIDNDFDLHERTWPQSPALDELYDAYIQARRSESGNPCIGRELPGLLKKAGFSNVDLHLVCAHNKIVGDSVFLKAEGSGIPAQLVKSGHLKNDALDRIAHQWHTMLATTDHAIFRMLLAATGVKPEQNSMVIESKATVYASSIQPESLLPSSETISHTPDNMRKFIREFLAHEMNMAPDAFPATESLIHLGVDSLAAVSLCNELKSRFSISLTVADVLSDGTIDDITKQVLGLMKKADMPASKEKGREQSQLWEEGEV